MALLVTISLLAQTPPQKSATFSSTTNVVVVDATVLDRNGKAIDNLTKDDFLLYEDGKQQILLSAELQRLETVARPAPELKTRTVEPVPPDV